MADLIDYTREDGTTAAALVTGRDEKAGTVNLRVFGTAAGAPDEFVNHVTLKPSSSSAAASSAAASSPSSSSPAKRTTKRAPAKRTAKRTAKRAAAKRTGGKDTGPK